MPKLSNKELIKRIEAHQANPTVHHLTCRNNSQKHRNLVPKEIEGRVILGCLDCDYIQTHVPNVFYD